MRNSCLYNLQHALLLRAQRASFHRSAGSALSMASRALEKVPKDAKKKLFFTSTQEAHDGRPVSAPGENFHSLRETKHVMERASSAPAGEKWGTSYNSAFGQEPVFVDLEVNRCLAELSKSGKAYVKAPHVGTSSYSTAFGWKGGPKPPNAKVPDCGVRQALSSGVSGQLISQAGYTYTVRPNQPVPEKFIPVDQLGVLSTSYDFLQSSYVNSFQSSTRPGRNRPRALRRSKSELATPLSMTSTYRLSFTRGV